ncbi:MAG TPA: DegT/DnrJ/EryC1/StrS family aminotransferase [Candidatus Omnitrophota bacterium]|nr:DegT/DnrJ/EryC1/StrS family aminotransferase [Candidatus Omnitrophota bacterium]
MSVPFFDLKRQIASIKLELSSAIDSVIDSGAFILGPNVAALEKHAADYIGCKHAIGVASGTDALHLALRGININPGDEVITTPFTFVATIDAIYYCGAKPVFVDIEPNTYNLDPLQIKKKITKKTKAIIPVHLYGQSVNFDPLLKLSKDLSIPIIEDCAQAIGAEYHQQKVGSFGACGCFSFFPTKNLGCFGDGGLITTNDDKIADTIRVFRAIGSRKTYHYDIIGYNSRLDALQAAILLVRFKYLDEWTRKRRHNANLYKKLLKDIPEITCPYELPDSLHVFNQFTIRPKDRDELFEFLKTKGIGAMVYYPLSLHLQAAFAELGHHKGDFPESEKAQDQVLSLPIFPELSEDEIREVCFAIRSFYGKN